MVKLMHHQHSVTSICEHTVDSLWRAALLSLYCSYLYYSYLIDNINRIVILYILQIVIDIWFLPVTNIIINSKQLNPFEKKYNSLRQFIFSCIEIIYDTGNDLIYYLLMMIVSNYRFQCLNLLDWNAIKFLWFCFYNFAGTTESSVISDDKLKISSVINLRILYTLYPVTLSQG